MHPSPAPARRYLLYIHVPFCESLCPFCTFHRRSLERQLAQRYFKALKRELQYYRDAGFDFAEVYVGGGTPTVLPDELGVTLDLVRHWFRISRLSVETNPNHLCPPTLEVLKQAGVNRLSVGVQSLDDRLLDEMERLRAYGSSASILERVESALGRFDTFNVDMIFNFPHQTMRSLRHDLRTLKDLAVDQISYYPIMPATGAGAPISSRMGRVEFNRERAMYHTVMDALMPDYQPRSAWCFSRQIAPIDEYIVDHDEYLGIGSGSFSYLNGVMFANTFSMERYLELTARSQPAVSAYRALSLREQIRYDFLMRLFGLHMDKTFMSDKYGPNYRRALSTGLLLFKLLGALVETDQEYRVTPEGRYYWVLMMREFFMGVNRLRDQMRTQIPGR